MDLLIWVKRKLAPVVGRLGLRPLASRVYRLLLRVRYGRDGLAAVRQNGRTWKLHHEVGLRGEYQEFDTIQWLRRVVTAGDCVFDIGANVGQMTLEVAELVGPTGRVIAVEPAPGNVRLLRSHVEANGFADRVTIIEAACGEADGGTLTLHVSGDTPDSVGSGHNVQGPQGGDAGRWTAVDVPVVSVDGVCERLGVRPTVLKIDVEGAELAVLTGSRRTLEQLRPAVRVGFHPFAFPDPAAATGDIRRLFAAGGYDTPEPPSGVGYELAEYEATPRPGEAAVATGSCQEHSP